MSTHNINSGVPWAEGKQDFPTCIKAPPETGTAAAKGQENIAVGAYKKRRL